MDDSVPEHCDLSSSSRGLSSEPREKVVSGKHSFHTHSPKDRNSDICLRTKITRASCRKRTGTIVPRAVLRAEKVGDLTSADHNVLSEGCQSRNNHRCAMMVQVLATQWIQPYRCKTNFLHETERSQRKFLEPSENQLSVTLTLHWNFGNCCAELSWNHRISTVRRSETNGITERGVRRIKEGSSSVLLLSGLDEKWLADSMECHCYL